MASFTDRNMYIQTSFSARNGPSQLQFDLLLGSSIDKHYLRIEHQVAGYTDSSIVLGEDLPSLLHQMRRNREKIDLFSTFRSTVSPLIELSRRCTYQGVWETVITETRQMYDVPHNYSTPVKFSTPLSAMQYDLLLHNLPRLIEMCSRRVLPQQESYTLPLYRRQCMNTGMCQYFSTMEEASRDPDIILNNLVLAIVIDEDNYDVVQLDHFPQMSSQSSAAFRDATEEEEEEDPIDVILQADETQECSSVLVDSMSTTLDPTDMNSTFDPMAVRSSTPHSEAPSPPSLSNNLLDDINIDYSLPPAPPLPPTHTLMELRLERPTPYDLCFAVSKRFYIKMTRKYAENNPQEYNFDTGLRVRQFAIHNWRLLEHLLREMLENLDYSLNTPSDDMLTFFLTSTSGTSPFCAAMYSFFFDTCENEKEHLQTCFLDALFVKFVGCYFDDFN